MLQSNARPAFLTACACHALFAVAGGFTIEAAHTVGYVAAMIGDALVLIAAIVMGLRLLIRDEGIQRRWVKAAIVFLALGPLGFWGIHWPAVLDTACIDRCFSAGAVAFHERAIGDVIQSQIAMIAVALAALFCATRATTAPLGELAV